MSSWIKHKYDESENMCAQLKIGKMYCVDEIAFHFSFLFS